MTSLKDLKPGDKFRQLTFIQMTGDRSGGKANGLFKCDCGKEVVRIVANVTKGKTSSCGCYKVKYLQENRPGYKHGLGKHPVYDVWNLMRRRCEEVEHKNYHQYGGRGIKLCKEWHDVTTFIHWAENNGWEKGLQLDRINTNGNYEPGNCRFVTSMVNNNNRRDNHLITCNGVTHTLQQWANERGIHRKTISARLKLGWPPEIALGFITFKKYFIWQK